MARKKKVNVCAECGELAPEDDFLCSECRARKKAEAAAKRAATIARNAEIREREEAAQRLAAMTTDLEQINERLPKLYADYTDLLDRINRDKGFDRKKWNRLDQLQSSILGHSARKRNLIQQLETA